MLRVKKVLSVSLVALWASGCVGSAEDPTDTNTNWFESCTEDSDCAGALSCLCGQCTAPCEESSDCSEADGDVQCVSADECSGAPRVCSRGMDEPTQTSADAGVEDETTTNEVDSGDEATETDGNDAGSEPAQRVCPGPYRVKTQAELDALEGCTEIQSTLTIEFDADLEPLSQLERAEYINLGGLEETLISSLQGLRSLRYAEGISLSNVGITTLAGLENLQTVGDYTALLPPSGISISHAPNLESLAALEGLEELGQLVLIDNPKLTGLEGLEALTRLDSLAFAEMNALTSTEGLAGVTSISTMSITTCPELEDLVFPSLESVQLVSLEKTSLTSLSGLSAVQSIPEFMLRGNTELEILSLPVLQSASFRFLIADNPKLTELELPELATLGPIEIYNNPSLPMEQAEQLAEAAEHVGTPKIGRNLGDETPPRDPCPWSNDIWCDEAEGSNLCAKDTDPDCDVVPL